MIESRNSPTDRTAPESADVRAQAVAKRLARLEWKARASQELRQDALAAGKPAMAREFGKMAEAARTKYEAQRAWADAAARWEAAGADLSFLGDLDPEKLGGLPETAFAQLRRTCPDVRVPGRPEPALPEIPAAGDAPETPPSPAEPARTAPGAQAPAPFSTMPVLAPEAPVRPQAKNPAREKPAAAPKTAGRASVDARPRPAALPEKPRASQSRPSVESARRRAGPASADVIDYDIRRLAKGARFSGADVAASAARHGVPPELLAAFLRNDSRYGTRGHGASNNNPGNVGQFDRLKNPVRGYATSQEGLDAAAANLARRIGAYRDATGRDDWTARELATGRTRDGQKFYGAYMTDKNGPANVEKIYAQLAAADIKGAPWKNRAAA